MAGLEMLRSSFSPSTERLDPIRSGLDVPSTAAEPTVTRFADGRGIDHETRVSLAGGALRGMSLTEGFAPLVVFLGHGSSVTNNPQAAGLACGACGGQSGEVNARVLAALLNDPAVRTGLAGQDIIIPERTRFVGGLHDTATDEVVLFPAADVGASHADAIAEFRSALVRAGRRNRRWRAPALGIETSDDREMAEAFQLRAADRRAAHPYARHGPEGTRLPA
jgi:uncharacterized protein YbcC (UPF0753/DUF2309 family)